MRSICGRSRSATIIRSCCGRAKSPAAQALGFKVASEDDLDRAADWFKRRNLPTAFPDVPHQGRTLRTADITGMPLEFYFKMDQSERMLQRYSAYQGARIQRIDHINCFTPDVQASYDFYTELGFRLTEYTETDDTADPKLWAVWLHRKGNVHDLAFTNGRGPRLHHIGVWTAGTLDILHICDVMATVGLSRQHGARARPARHLQRVLSLYPRSGRPPHRAVHQRLPHGRSRPRAVALVADRSAAADLVGPSGAEVVVRGGFRVPVGAGSRAGAGSTPGCGALISARRIPHRGRSP